MFIKFLISDIIELVLCFYCFSDIQVKMISSRKSHHKWHFLICTECTYTIISMLHTCCTGLKQEVAVVTY